MTQFDFPRDKVRPEDVEMPWTDAIGLRFGYLRMRRLAELSLALAVGFAAGALLKISLVAEIAVAVSLLVVAVALSLLAQGTHRKALEYRQRFMLGMTARIIEDDTKREGAEK